MTGEPLRSSAAQADPVELELSIVLPCLDEADTVGVCVEKALRALEEGGISGEVIVADNGSRDGSQELAAGKGARVIPVAARGYGNALIGGIAAARGRYVLMADADDSYDLLDIGKFLVKLREGYDLVHGCRLPAGGGRVMEDAMPFLHRWLGNPLFSLFARWWFRCPVHDVYCGMRGFRRDFYEGLKQRCTGMEFATEMIIKASLGGARICEVPIVLHVDGRKTHAPHLKTFRDGWRTLRFFMMYTPRWLFLVPGTLLILAGLLGYALVFLHITLGRMHFDAHTLLFASLALLCGHQSILFAVFTKTFAISEGLHPPDPRLERMMGWLSVETGALTGIAGFTTGIVFLAVAVMRWLEVNFGALDYARTMRWVIPGATLTALGLMTFLASFFLGILRLGRRH